MSEGLRWFFVGLMLYGTTVLGYGSFVQARLERRASARVLRSSAIVLACAAIALATLR